MDNTDNKICAICCENYNKSTRHKATCPSCQFQVCRTCIRTYLMGRSDDAHCLKCNRRWELDTLIESTGRTWVNTTYKKHRQKVLFDNEKSRLPETMPAVENYKICQTLETKSKDLQDQIRELQRQANALKNQQSTLNNELYQRRRGGGIKEKRKFIKACPAEGCRGFLSTQWKCGLCDTHVCSKCFVIKETDEGGEIIPHECKEEDLKTAEMIRKETRPCPSCGSQIYKIEGCDQMWCTQCHTAFSWRSGLKVTGVIHNPHFYAWQNTGAAAPAVNVPGAVMCGGLPPLYTYRQEIMRGLQTPYAFRNRTSSIGYSDTEMLTRIAVGLHRASSHFTHVELDRVRRVCNGAENNEEMRIKYILNEITEHDMRTQLMRKDKKRKKSTAILQIYELVNTVFTESIRDIMHSVTTTNADETREEAVQRNLLRCEALRDYANDELAKISVLYSQTVAVIEPDFYTTRYRYRATDLKA